MKNLTLPKLSKRNSVIVLLVILLLGIPLTLYQTQITQIFKQFAWHTTQSATAVCAPTNGSVHINVQFTNTESTKDMIVTATDLQTNTSLNLGTVRHGETKLGEIDTKKTAISKGSVAFNLKWADGSSGTDQFFANYQATGECTNPTPTPPACPADAPKNQGYCRWDAGTNATGYSVQVKETASGNIVKEATVQAPATELAFTMEPGKSYQCSVTTINACGTGTKVDSPEKVCQVPTPTPTGPFCPTNESSCVWDALDGATEYKVDVLDENDNVIKSETVKHPTNRLSFPTEPGKGYRCSVTPINLCSQGKIVTSELKICTTPSGTPTPTTPITPTIPVPTETPTPSEVPTPTVTPTSAPTPTNAPTPTRTPTPTRVPTPTRIPTPTPRIIQQQGQTIVQRGGVNVVQQPGQTVVQQPPQVVQTTPGPTVVPTGDNNVPVIIGGFTLILTLAGAILFFAL